MMNWMTNSRKLLFAGVALAAGFGLALSAQAQTCTIGNWTGAPTNLSDANAGTQGSSNRRYGGPCGLRVALDGTAHYVTDPTPGSETTYIARFYVFLENPGAGPITLFAADDGTADQIRVVFENDTIVLSVRNQSGTWVDLPAVAVGTGWHSVEFAWEQAGSASIALSVDGAADETATVDTTGITIANAHLGNLNAVGGGGVVDFDDFDSRRSSRPGRLMVGDADASAAITISDLFAVEEERTGGAYAAGQPDCDENGSITISDLFCVETIRTGG